MRANAVRRGSTAWMTASRSATQSPTAGSSAPDDASWRRRPARCARSSPASVSTSYSPRCCADTRPAMQLSCGSSAAAKPSSQPRSCKFKRSSFQEWVSSGRVPEARELATRGVLRRAGEPQALRPEGAVDVMSHLLCRNSGTRQSLAAGPGGLLALKGHGHRLGVDQIDPRLPLHALPGPDRLVQPHPRKPRPASNRRPVDACPRKIGRTRATGGRDEVRRLRLALARPLRRAACLPVVSRSDDGATSLGWCGSGPTTFAQPDAAPAIDRRLLVSLLEEGACRLESRRRHACTCGPERLQAWRQSRARPYRRAARCACANYRAAIAACEGPR